ncbi:MAG: alpha-2-macroglobulin family protein [Pirellulaceae bacterium]|nr:alpha-2-macroglobulin family protein [Pirellulaceae bacterium]
MRSDNPIHVLWVVAIIAASFLFLSTWSTAAQQDEEKIRNQALLHLNQGNWKDALDIFRRLAEDSSSNPARVPDDVQNAIQCLNNLGSMQELDEFLASVVEVHSNNWRALKQAAESIRNAPHHGIVASNAFHRAPQRNTSGVWVTVQEQDRQQSLTWLIRAIPLVDKETSAQTKGDFFKQLAESLLDHRDGQSSWLLQHKTEIDKAPDYLEIDASNSIHADRFAPVGEDGKPIVYSTPTSWDEATNDGQRLRWAIHRWSATHAFESQIFWSDFLNRQFGIETLANDPWFHRFQADIAEDHNEQAEAAKTKTGIYALHTLDDTETIARLANGIQRISLSDEFNPIRIQQTLIKDSPSQTGSYSRLIDIYANRRQYAKAAEVCRQAIKSQPKMPEFQEQLDSMTLPRGRFDFVEAQPAGKPATVGFVFRNAERASFTAAKVDVEKLLTDIQQFYRNHRSDKPPKFGGKDRYPPAITEPNDLFSTIKIGEYLSGTVANWTLDLKPRDGHWDRRIQVATPLQQAGLYVVTAKLQKPDHIARCLVWIHDTSIVQKKLDNKTLYYVADAITGLPIPNANVEFFGFAHEYNNGRAQPVKIANFAKKTSADGQVVIDAAEMPANHQWQVTARADGRLATLGFENLWYQAYSQQSFQQLKAYGVSDRPAYRPGEIMKAKFWIALASYATESRQAENGLPASLPIPIRMVDPQGTAIWTGVLETDRLGGADIELTIPKDTKLGLYHFQIQEGRIPTGLMIRVEEYRKPEFEVTIDAPDAPIQLGEQFQATIRAKYYFGSPVTDATVNVKVTRTAFKDNYYPSRPFDWCYGPGYWWTAYDLDWFPGWRRWAGCFRPLPWWFPHRNEEPPELILQQEVKLDANGEAKIDIDSSLALAFQSNSDHRYKIEVDVRDASRRTLSASGDVIAARHSFKIYSWGERGYYRSGDKMVAQFQARTLGGKPVAANGKLELLRVTYDPSRAPIENIIDTWDVKSDEEGNLTHTMQAGRSGQYRLKLTLTDAAEHTVEGGYLTTVRGDSMQGTDFRFSALELIPDKSEYATGEVVRLQVNADRDDALVWLFVRPQGSVYPVPKKVQLSAKSSIVEIPVVVDDQPNFFVEAFTIYDGRFHQEAREIIVPPQQRVLNVEVTASKKEYLPGEEAEVEIAVTGTDGKPVEGSAVLAVYDRSLEQIAPDAVPPDIREFFWKWRRQHYPQATENLSRRTLPVFIENMPSAMPLGIFGTSMSDDAESMGASFSMSLDASFRRGSFSASAPQFGGGMRGGMIMESAAMPRAPMAKASRMMAMDQANEGAPGDGDGASGTGAQPPIVRKDFADAAYWLANLQFDKAGKGKAKFKMPENLTSWQIGVWSMASGVRVGSGKTSAVTRKNLMVRLQTPRFLVDRDDVVVSALVNNEFDDAIDVQVHLEQEGDFLRLINLDHASQSVTVPAHGQKRVDWRCKASKPGEAKLRVAATSARESDAMELKLPVVINGTLKTESFAGTVRPDQTTSTIPFTVPEARLVDQSRLTIRLSPSLAMSMVDALPYLVDYPHGCTEQTLNRFVPTVITHKTLLTMGIDLRSLQEKRINLNAQELGAPAERAGQWKKFDRNPVFDNDEVSKMVDVGLRRLTEMQCADGGWGWFSGVSEHSWPHTTAVVVRGLLAAKAADAPIVPHTLDRGLDWLTRYQAEQLQALRNAKSKSKKRPSKELPDDLDAFVFHVLVAADRRNNEEMLSFLYENRNSLSVHSKTLLAIATHQLGDLEKTKMLRQNIEQFLVQDAENETAYLRDQSPWWYWYGSSIEATANYLKLIVRIEPQSPTASRLVKYLLNNRKNATYWNSTRDTALVIEAFAEYLGVTEEGKHDLKADVVLDGQSIGSVEFSAQTLFEANNTIELIGAAVKPGSHKLEIKKTGKGSLYWNVYQTNFTLEEEIQAAGLEIKVDRRYYRLDAIEKELLLAGDRGQIDKGERAAFDRVAIEDLSEVKSGQMVEVELLVESKNDYEYLILSDPKAASFEPIETQSGYSFTGGLSIYREFRDQFVGMYLRSLPRGSHSIRYRLRCEAPGRFTALPATVLGMYAPELVGNSKDFDVIVVE